MPRSRRPTSRASLGTGLLWLLTGGLFTIGWLYDFCALNRQVDECNRP